MLRQAALCHADLSLTTFKWTATTPKPMFDARPSSHFCVDWEALIKTIKHRVVSTDEIKRLVNPLI